MSGGGGGTNGGGGGGGSGGSCGGGAGGNGGNGSSKRLFEPEPTLDERMHFPPGAMFAKPEPTSVPRRSFDVTDPPLWSPLT